MSRRTRPVLVTATAAVLLARGSLGIITYLLFQLHLARWAVPWLRFTHEPIPIMGFSGIVCMILGLMLLKGNRHAIWGLAGFVFIMLVTHGGMYISFSLHDIVRRLTWLILLLPFLSPGVRAYFRKTEPLTSEPSSAVAGEMVRQDARPYQRIAWIAVLVIGFPLAMYGGRLVVERHFGLWQTWILLAAGGLASIAFTYAWIMLIRKGRGKMAWPLTLILGAFFLLSRLGSNPDPTSSTHELRMMLISIMPIFLLVGILTSIGTAVVSVRRLLTAFAARPKVKEIATSVTLMLAFFIIMAAFAIGGTYVSRGNCYRSSGWIDWSYDASLSEIARLAPGKFPSSARLVHSRKAANMGTSIVAVIRMDGKDADKLISWVRSSYPSHCTVSHAERLEIRNFGPPWFRPDSADKFVAITAGTPDRDPCGQTLSVLIDLTDPRQVIAYLWYNEC